MEPLLVKYANHHQFPVRFNTELISAERLPSSRDDDDNRPHRQLACTIRDLTTQTTYTIRTTFLLGADGGRSTVARIFAFPFCSHPPHGVACNVLVDMDLTYLMLPARAAQLHWIVRPDRNRDHNQSSPLLGGSSVAPCLRLVRPWTQWLFITVLPGAATKATTTTTTDSSERQSHRAVNPFPNLAPSDPDLIAFIRECVGDASVPVTVRRLDPWVVRETVAERLDDGNVGNVFLLGDAAHRHPPAYGLGGNTCVQDAYNLAWKLAFVRKGLAGKGLLDTYSVERQPVGRQLVAEANEGMRQHWRVWEALGVTAETAEEGARQIRELGEAGEAGVKRREALHEALTGARREGESLGLAMNQWYASTAVYLGDEPAPRPRLEGDPLVKIQVSTYPGTRLPHAWLDVPTRRKEVSTHDLAGHASFCLFTGHGGEAWKRATEAIREKTGIPIRAYGIGFGLDFYDVYGEWRERREVAEDGCVLVRPDRFTAWRAMQMVPECEEKLGQVLDKILSRGTSES